MKIELGSILFKKLPKVIEQLSFAGLIKCSLKLSISYKHHLLIAFTKIPSFTNKLKEKQVERLYNSSSFWFWKLFAYHKIRRNMKKPSISLVQFMWCRLKASFQVSPSPLSNHPPSSPC